jgi:hypothetical protein
VTFQIALAGKDGLVVASDQLATRPVQFEKESTPTIEYCTQEKFIKSHDDSLICFFSGGPMCQEVASTIAIECSRHSLSNLRFESALRRAANKVAFLRNASVGDQIIVVRRKIADAVWLVQRSVGGIIFVTHYRQQYLCTGNSTVARFLPLHLWSNQLLISELKKLALLTLNYAARENPGSIGPPFDVMCLYSNNSICWSQEQADEAGFAAFNESLNAAFANLS